MPIEQDIQEDQEYVDIEDSQQLTTTDSHHTQYMRVTTEIANVAERYAAGDDARAEQYLEELVARQSAESPKLVVKSLCNIASRVSAFGRNEVSLTCLMRAFEQPVGLDAILYMQIARELCGLKEFDKALECYEKAREFDDGSSFPRIRDGIIRVLTEKGEYDQALDLYLEIDDIDDQPSTLASMGKLHRKMGNLREARNCYLQVIGLMGGRFDVAQAGLAEVAKQSGRLHHAIRIYNNLLRNEELDPGSRRVYSLALAHLFRMTGQLSKSVILLNGIILDAPSDYEAHFQLANCYMLDGNMARASHHINLAKIPDLDGIAYELYRVAMSVQRPTPETQKAGMEYRSPVKYLPEDRGLAGCKNALAFIAEGQYEGAITAIEGVEFIDKIQGDFSTILQFHARKQLDNAYDYRDDASVCRIMKRGFRPLKEAAIEIARADFGEALKYEWEFCLRVA